MDSSQPETPLPIGSTFLKKKFVTPLIHVVLWLCLFLYPFIFHFIPITDIRAVTRIALFLTLLIAFFYLNTNVFIPRLLGRKRVLLYLIAVVGVIFLVAFLAGFIQVFLNPDYFKKPEIFDRAFNTGIITGILTLIISSSIKVTTEWFRNQQLTRSAENERLSAEINFLKSQVNPHFLFNALNNIYSLENQKSPDTGPAILKLSDLIRYMTYETGADHVILEKEIDYLRNYIELQKLGLRRDICIEFAIAGDMQGKWIKPLLLIPLIENIFKHGISHSHDSSAAIVLNISGNRLEMTTQNHVTGKTARDKAGNGIGLQNLRKRLDIFYPGNYELQTIKKDDIFMTHLSVPLK